MRYLTRQFAIGALRRGHGIEQFLGGTEIDGGPAIRWVAISPVNRQYRISLHTVHDPDDDRTGDLPNFISLDPVDEAYVGEGRDWASGRTRQKRCRLPSTVRTPVPTAG